MKYTLNQILSKYSEKNIDNRYEPVAVGKYGIRKRSEIYKKELANDYSKNKLIHQNTMTIGLGSKQIDFGVLIEEATYSVSPAYSTFHIDTSVVLAKYLELFLKYNNDYYAEKYMIASARQGKKVDISNLLKESIDVPNFKKQEEVVNNINSITQMIEKDEELILTLNELVQSKFNEMFGRCTDTCLVEDIITEMRTDYRRLLVELIMRKRVKSTDFYVCRGNGNMKLVGSGAYSAEDRNDLVFPDTVIALGIDTSKVCLPYLFIEWMQPRIRRQIEAGARTTNGTHKIKQPVVSKTKINIPPLDEQNEFAAFYAQIELIISQVKRRVQLYEELFQGKMAKYFSE